MHLKDLTIGSSDRGSRLHWAKEGVDDWDKVPSFVAGEAPRRSTSSLDEMTRLTPPPPESVIAPMDARGATLSAGDLVRILEIPAWLPRDLPTEEIDLLLAET